MKKTINIILINGAAKFKFSNNLENKPLKLYVCGITPYDFAHIGHGRCYIVFDTLVRLFRFFKIEITYCRNVTDIDDKLINKAIVEFGNGNKYKDLANYYFYEFSKNMNDLNCLKPDYEPKVTNYIDEIIKSIDLLIKNKSAYILNNDVYFSVDSYKKYGTLSNRNLDEQIVGVRVLLNDLKKNSMDFALWKGSEEEPYFKSPWGNGRPGWHIECSSMINTLFGDTIDIHGGGMDLLFPHHENERAQSECLNNREFVKCWIHCAFININKQKMSKSLNNSIILNDFFKKYDPMIFRYYILNHHYSTPIDFCWDDIYAFEKSYETLVNIFKDVEYELNFDYDYNNEILNDIYNSAFNNLNIAESIGKIFKYKNKIESDLYLKKECKKFLNLVCGLTLKNKEKINEIENYSIEIKKMIEDREIARKNKDFKKADEIRDELKKLGINLNDKKI